MTDFPAKWFPDYKDASALTLFPLADRVISAEPAPVRECRGIAEIRTIGIAQSLPYMDLDARFPTGLTVAFVFCLNILLIRNRFDFKQETILSLFNVLMSATDKGI
jgi:hypothetical protein